MSTQSEFKGDDYDFVAGSIKGLRSWGLDNQGRLRGVTHPAAWLPGENVATCAAKTRCDKLSGSHVHGYTYYLGVPTHHYVDPTAVPEDKRCTVEGCDGVYHPPTHTFDADCECGFWAYDELAFTEHGDVSGVIEGYGHTTIGTRGFRCEKARVVALCRERETDVLGLSKWLRLQQLYPEAEFFTDYDDMVAAHGEVLHVWDDVDETFWTDIPDTERSDAYVVLLAQLQAQSAAIAAQAQSMTFTSTTPNRFWPRPGGGQS